MHPITKVFEIFFIPMACELSSKRNLPSLLPLQIDIQGNIGTQMAELYYYTDLDCDINNSTMIMNWIILSIKYKLNIFVFLTNKYYTYTTKFIIE